ncbi:hypothetical protein O181_108545 [Austropuccinia psidii MF-1]|uniref:Reverse transcriptase RNase H-like domain-containing protein n=1 Tax=Austropuccinia psidii MF-1 TaxID=1389203 RepID=A0A9Q3JSK6_9BASI|nr:hypothetical protein [Austropuccinia psidii MF-1]
MDITLKIDTSYHERQKEKNHHQEKNPEASKSSSSHPQISSSSLHKKKKNFQKRDKPHSSLLNKDFNWGDLLVIKPRVSYTQGLHFRESTDASNYALGAVLSQVSDSGKHPIAFDSCKVISAALNYDIHDKEVLGIVWALKHWRAFLLSLSSPFEVLTNHSSLQYFMSSKVLTFLQAFWVEFLSEFHFSITYGPGHLATLPDALSRRDDIYPERGEDFVRLSLY